MNNWIMDPWPWYIAGPLIAIIMFLMLYFGKSFGISSSFRYACTLMGAGKKLAFFDLDWRQYKWNLYFVLGMILGGFIAQKFMMNDEAMVNISLNTRADLLKLGILDLQGLLPQSIFGVEALKSFSGLCILIFGGLLIGFGTRYAGGCTSGHAISGLSSLQAPSLVAVIGFLLGGLAMTHLLMPLIF